MSATYYSMPLTRGSIAKDPTMYDKKNRCCCHPEMTMKQKPSYGIYYKDPANTHAHTHAKKKDALIPSCVVSVVLL